MWLSLALVTFLKISTGTPFNTTNNRITLVIQCTFWITWLFVFFSFPVTVIFRRLKSRMYTRKRQICLHAINMQNDYIAIARNMLAYKMDKMHELIQKLREVKEIDDATCLRKKIQVEKQTKIYGSKLILMWCDVKCLFLLNFILLFVWSVICDMWNVFLVALNECFSHSCQLQPNQPKRNLLSYTVEWIFKWRNNNIMICTIDFIFCIVHVPFVVCDRVLHTFQPTIIHPQPANASETMHVVSFECVASYFLVKFQAIYSIHG